MSKDIKLNERREKSRPFLMSIRKYCNYGGNVIMEGSMWLKKLVCECCDRGWEFQLTRDDNDDYTFSMVLGNDFYVCKTAENCEELCREIRRYW